MSLKKMCLWFFLCLILTFFVFPLGFYLCSTVALSLIIVLAVRPQQLKKEEIVELWRFLAAIVFGALLAGFLRMLTGIHFPFDVFFQVTVW